MKLYSYFLSSAAFRVRIALALKKVDYDTVPVHLMKNGGEHKSPDYQTINPQQLVPALDDNGFVLTQSLAIIEYLEDRYPQIPLLPDDVQERAWVRAAAYLVACDIHPLDNLRVLNYLKNDLNVNDEQKQTWYAHWITQGFGALETLMLERYPGDTPRKFCYGDTPTMADCCLIPQVYNAKRFNVDLSKFPNIVAIYEHCISLPAFIQASPKAWADLV
ncbi:maleylacetoacetate isomerase [Moraxella nasovis]|uniref:maleylacetoacetate isomerase n=1 Tax=Moraxella nasovis TaxID=2904121 RepID=UPI001F610F70|nr:maleylacetoacetate isomerase [Moraxella nasovis]UNU74292.1 maleylacetoacetate isomerase [Moraxella nasovis]